MQLKWTELALKDLDQIETYIAENNSKTVAIDVVLKVIDSTELVLSDHPYAGRTGRVKTTRELVIADIPFVVIYRYLEIPQEVQVLRVLHDAQQWPKSS